ncbi:MAG TPA: hypothetical protein VKN99_09415 [Polyangia bacterium]|nr:hypothetical protein [Polyangia bacterium]
MWVSLVVLATVIGSPPKLEALVAAARKGDPVELDRVARRLGAARLGRALANGPIDLQKAALEAAPRVDESWTLLVPAARLCGSASDPLGQAAARAVRRIASQLVSGAPNLTEVPRDVVAVAVQALLHVARAADLAAARRADAIGLVALLSPLSPPARPELLALLDDAAPPVRRAAVDALAADPGATDALARLLERDAQPQVAAGAAAALCRRLPRIHQAAWTRLRELALSAKIDPADGIDLVLCLAAGGQEDRALVAEAARKHPLAPVRAVAADLHKALTSAPAPTLRPAPPPKPPGAKPPGAKK